MKLRILVADDHELVRRGICALLASHPDWEICGEARHGWEAVEKAAELQPDIVILDIRMPRLDGLEAARLILQRNRLQRVAILSIHDSEQVIEKALRAGAKAYVLKSDVGKHLTNAVEALQQNRSYFNPRLRKILLGGFLDTGRVPLKGASIVPNLTSRERETLLLLLGGISTKELAVALGVTIRTAETHRSNLMRKLNLHSLSELVLYALRNNILRIPGEQSGGDRSGQFHCWQHNATKEIPGDREYGRDAISSRSSIQTID